MSFTIRGIGTALPSAAISQDESRRVAFVLGGETVEGATWLNVVYTNCGVQTRHQIIGEGALKDLLTGSRESGSPFLPNPATPRGPSTATRMKMYADPSAAPAMAVASASAALRNANLEPDTITHLITVTCTGFFAPGLDHALIRGLNLKPTVERLQVGFMGCHGAMNGLKAANAFATANPNARVLLSATELCSLHYYMGEEPGKIVANALFADGSASVAGDGLSAGWRVTATGSCVLPDSAKDMSWTIGDYGFEMTLSKRVPDLIGKHLRPWLTAWLKGHGVEIEQVGSWAIHPGGPKIVAAVKDTLGLSHEALAASLGVLADYGNMSSPTVLFILDRLQKANAPLPCVMLGFGPGLVAEAALVQ